MGMIKEFKDFIARGNVIDLAVGVVIGAAFGKIINSLVEDIITPIILKPALEAARVGRIEEWAPGGVLLGKFIAAIISFLVIAFVLFLLIKGINATTRKKEDTPVTPSEPSSTDKLLIEIRDVLQKNNK